MQSTWLALHFCVWSTFPHYPRSMNTSCLPTWTLKESGCLEEGAVSLMMRCFTMGCTSDRHWLAPSVSYNTKGAGFVPLYKGQCHP